MPLHFPFYSIGHFINQPANPTPFEITRFGDMAEPDVDDPHKHTFYEILWIDAGQSRQTIDYTPYDLRPGSLFFISPGQLHDFGEWQHLAGGSIFFTEDFLLLNQQNRDRLFELSFLDNVYANPCLNPSPTDFADIRQTIDLIWREKQRPDASASIGQSLLLVLLDQIQRCVDASVGKVVSQNYVLIYKRLKQILDQHFTENQSVSYYADQLNITQHHLNVVVKSVTGRTAGAVIRARSLLEAKRLLTFSDLTVTELADQLGFTDSSHLAKVFRAEVGQSPQAFRLAMSEIYRKKYDLAG